LRGHFETLHNHIWADENEMAHRLDGPAVLRKRDGGMEWFIHGHRYYNFKDFQEAGKLTDDQITILILKYGEIK